MGEDWWIKERKLYEVEQSQLMRYLRITLYGSFYPEAQKRNLQDLSTHLASKGFADTDLVQGARRPIGGFASQHEASIFYLEHSDLNLLIFTRQGKRLGVTSECDHVLNSPSMCSKWGNNVIFDQQSADGSRGSIGPLQIARISELNSSRQTRVYVVPFKTFEELKQTAYLYAKDQFIAILPELKRRSRAMRD